jgi:hypothetical protein
MSLKKKDKISLASAIENEGFDYAFRFYSSFEEIKDPKFHALRQAYIKAADELQEYLGLDLDNQAI